MGETIRNTTRQREAGAASRAETRRRLIAAARELFAECGYAVSTVTKIAQRAGVSLQTLYLACGSKRELLQVVLAEALADSPAGIEVDYVNNLHIQLSAATDDATPEPDRTLRAFAKLFRHIAERAHPWWRVYRDAAGADREIADDWAALTAKRRETTAELLAELADDQLPPGLTRETLVDTIFVIASPETCQLLLENRGYTLDRYEQWLSDTLCRAVNARQLTPLQR